MKKNNYVATLNLQIIVIKFKFFGLVFSNKNFNRLMRK